MKINSILFLLFVLFSLACHTTKSKIQAEPQSVSAPVSPAVPNQPTMLSANPADTVQNASIPSPSNRKINTRYKLVLNEKVEDSTSTNRTVYKKPQTAVQPSDEMKVK